MTAIDTNVLLDIVIGVEPFASRALRSLDDVRGGLSVAPVVVAELIAHPGWKAEDVEPFIEAIGADIGSGMTRTAWFRAGETYAAYARRRLRSGAAAGPRRPIADFIIGAHAEGAGALITRDTRFFRSAFPKLRLIEPQ